MIVPQLDENNLKLTPKTLSEKWVYLYSDEFYTKTFEVINDKEKSLKIIKDTFFTGLKHFNTYKSIKNERDWLLGVLNYNIKENSADIDSFKKNNLCITSTLNKMPEIQRKAFILKNYNGYGIKNICDLLNIDEKHFWFYIHKTHNELKKQMSLEPNYA